MKYAVRLVLAMLMIAAVATAATAAPQEKAAKSMTATGKVTAVAGNSLSIQKGSETMTFGIDNTTKFVGKGLSTKSGEKAAKGEKMTATDAVASGDIVTVTYHDMAGTLHASQVKITQKAFTTK